MPDRRTIWDGRKPVRAAVYMASLVATRHNQTIRAFYERLCAGGKAKKLAIAACMRKLLAILNDARQRYNMADGAASLTDQDSRWPRKPLEAA